MRFTHPLPTLFLAVFVASCQPYGFSPQARLDLNSPEGRSGTLHQMARYYGSRLDPQQERQVDEYLGSVTQMKADVEFTTRQLKQMYVSDPIRLQEVQNSYDRSTESLRLLGAWVKNDFQQNLPQPSESTRAALRGFEDSGNEIRSLYAQATQQGRFGTALLVILNAAGELMSLWDSYGEAQRQAYMAAIDQRLSPADWTLL